MGQYLVQIEDQVSSEELENYVKQNDPAELVATFRNIPIAQQKSISEFMSDILADRALRNTEKISRASERLSAEQIKISA
jgi:hypothetical protein